MDAMTYVNIFETKGLEYLLVLLFLIGFMLLLRSLTPRDRSTTQEAPVVGAGPPMTCIADFECPFRAHPTDASDGETDSEDEDIVV